MKCTPGFLVKFLCTGLLAFSASGYSAEALVVRPKGADVLEAMKRANDHFVAEWPEPGTLSGLPRRASSATWTRAVYFEGALAFYRVSHDPAVLDYATRWGEFHGWNLETGISTKNADNQCAGQSYIELFQLDPGHPERLVHIRENLDHWIETRKVNFYSWIDALQMSMPSFARLGVIDGNPKYFEAMFTYYNYAKQTLGLFNTDDGFWYRDVRFKPPYATPNGKPCYWSRGNGWVLAGLARVLEVLPKQDPHRGEYEATFRKMCAALVKVQREDGFWNANLGDPDHFGGPETTGSALFIYGFAWGVRTGLLPADPYADAAAKGWNALATKALHPDGFLGFVQRTGDDPSDGQPLTYDTKVDFDDFGLGCFLLAGSEVYALDQAKFQ